MIVAKSNSIEDLIVFNPGSDGSETKFIAPLIIVSSIFGLKAKKALQSGQKVVISMENEVVVSVHADTSL